MCAYLSGDKDEFDRTLNGADKDELDVTPTTGNVSFKPWPGHGMFNAVRSPMTKTQGMMTLAVAVWSNGELHSGWSSYPEPPPSATTERKTVGSPNKFMHIMVDRCGHHLDTVNLLHS